MTLIDPNIDLLPMVAEDFRPYAENGATLQDFISRIGSGGQSFFGGYLTYSPREIIVRDEDSSIVARFSPAELYRSLTQPRLPLM